MTTKITRKEEDWINKKWRPAMGWMYMVVCIFDFIIFPILYTLVQFWEQEAVNDAFRQWEPLTLSGAGLFHMAMGAVLGITAWSRGQEKMSGVANGPTQAQTSYASYSTPQQDQWRDSRSFAQSRTVEYNEPGVVLAGYKGKKAPAEPQYPEI